MKKCLFVLFLQFLICSCFGIQESLVVHDRVADVFSIKGFDFPYEEKKVPFSIELGSTLILHDEEHISLDGASYQVAFNLSSPQGGIYHFTSRVVNNNSENVIKKSVLKMRKVLSDFQAQHGVWQAWCIYQITLADNAIYDVEWFSPKYNTMEEAYRAFNLLSIDEEDVLIFLDQCNNYPILDKVFSILILHEGAQLPGNFNAKGYIRSSNGRENREDNNFEIKKSHREHVGIGGFCASFDVIIFQDFGIGYEFVINCNSPLKGHDLHAGQSLQFQSVYSNKGRNNFIFKDTAGKELHLHILRDHWTGQKYGVF